MKYQTNLYIYTYMYKSYIVNNIWLTQRVCVAWMNKTQNVDIN